MADSVLLTWAPFVFQLLALAVVYGRFTQQVKDLDKRVTEGSGTSKEQSNKLDTVKAELHNLALIVVRSDEKLVQLVRENAFAYYTNGDNARSVREPSRRRKKQVAQA